MSDTKDINVTVNIADTVPFSLYRELQFKMNKMANSLAEANKKLGEDSHMIHDLKIENDNMIMYLQSSYTKLSNTAVQEIKDGDYNG